MTEYSVAEARNNLSRLLAQVEDGKRVSITRRGKVVAKVVAADPKPPFRFDLEELRRRRVMPAGGPIDTLAVLEEMRAERNR